METGKNIVMANQKGGVAKTSSTRNLAYSLAELGKKVLAVDFDPQTNLTISFGVAPAALQETTASLMMKLVMDEAMPEKGSYILNIPVHSLFLQQQKQSYKPFSFLPYTGIAFPIPLSVLS